MSAKKSESASFLHARRKTIVPKQSRVDFTRSKKGHVITNLSRATDDLNHLVISNKRDALLRDFPFMTFPNTQWRNSFAQAALDLTKDQLADWKLLLTGCAVAWADDKALQKQSHEKFLTTLQDIQTYMPVADRPLRDQSYIDAVKNGVKIALFGQNDVYRATHLMHAPNIMLDRLRHFKAVRSDVVTEKRVRNRYDAALKRQKKYKNAMMLEYLPLKEDQPRSANFVQRIFKRH